MRLRVAGIEAVCRVGLSLWVPRSSLLLRALWALRFYPVVHPKALHTHGPETALVRGTRTTTLN